jgi:tetratricopeptide (TPR) repeat protein
MLLPALLIACWGGVLFGLPKLLPTQAASWVTFLALFITPGYLLGELVARRVALDPLERLALAFPLGVAALTPVGMAALLQHWTVDQLALGWALTSGAIIVGWALAWLVWARQAAPAAQTRWTLDEALLALLLATVFVLIVPTLDLYKIDGDAYAVNSFAADALAGLPLNATEPIFGTDLGPGVRMAFNQSLPMSYLWSYWSGIAPIPLSATASRSMLALWSLLATYMLGRAAGMGLSSQSQGRRFGLFVAAVQLLIYLAAPFLRGDNVSLFFFERITADKFMVPVTMLPVAFALAIRLLRSGERAVWLAAAVVTLAVSAIHPLIAAMLALALGAFAGLHFLLAWRVPAARRRSLALGALVGLVMVLPLVQLMLARGEAPLAASYPESVEGWPVGYKLAPGLPFVYLPTLDIAGPLPDLSQLDAAEVNSPTDPFLIWRFAVNMNRRRLLLFDLDHYISDPNIVLEPPYLLALLLLPLLLPGLRRNLGAQFALSTALAVVFVMFNPWVTPLIGSLVMPWILWRFIWLLPYALILALAAAPVVNLVGQAVGRLTRRGAGLARYAPLAAVVTVALLVTPLVTRNLQMLHERAAYPYYYPTPERLLARLDELTKRDGPATVLADQDLSVSIPAYVADAHIVAHRVPTTSEVFPADRQEEALQRLIDQAAFFRSRSLTQATVDILQRYDVGYVVAPSGSNLDIQLRLAPGWFEWVMDDQSYTLYRVLELPTATGTIRANTALAERRWAEAEELYSAELARDPQGLLAMVGMAEIAHARGRFNEALNWYAQALAQADLPVLHFRLGQLHTQLGQVERAVTEYDLAQQGAPYVARFHVAAGDACLSAGQEACAAEQYTAAVENRNLPDTASHLIALADLWRQRNRTDLALGLYEDAVALQPSQANQLMLASAYWEEARYGEAEALLGLLRTRHPLSVEVLALSAEVQAGQGQVDEAVAFYRRAIWLQEVTGQEASASRLALGRVLLAANRLDQAQREIDQVLALQPNNAAAYALQGDLSGARGLPADATVAYQKAFRLDPTQVQLYLALSNQFRQLGGEQEEMLNLLETAIRANPNEATLALALGDQLQRQGETVRAIDAYQSALDMFELASLSPNLTPRGADTSRAYAYIRLASVSEDLGLMEPAMNYYSAAVAAAPDLPWTQVTYGDALRRRNDVAAAEAAYRRAIANDPNFANAYVQLADLLTANGNDIEAQVLRNQALDVAFTLAAQPQTSKAQSGLSKTAPENDATGSFDSDALPTAGGVESSDAASEADRLLGELAGQESLFAGDNGLGVLNLLTRLSQTTGATDRVVELYQQALEQGQREGWYPVVLAQYHKGLGDLYLAQGLPVLAVESYRSAVAQDSWWPQPRLGLARALESLGQRDEALAQLEDAAQLTPGFVEAQVALANFYDQMNQPDAALAIYQQTADTHPGNPRATLALAQAWRDRQMWDEAERTYRRTLALTPGNSEAYVDLGALLIDLTRYDEARPMLVAALETNQDNINAYIQMGVLEQRQGNSELALDWFKRAVRVQPEDQPTSLVLLDLMQRYGHFETSLSYLRQDLAEYPQDIELLLRQARGQRILGKTGEAMATLLEASRLNVSDSRLSAELGELYIAQGRPQAALAAYRQTVALDPGEDTYTIRLAGLWQSQAQFEQAEATLLSGVSAALRVAPVKAALADLYLRQGRIQDAKELLDQALVDLGPEPTLVMAMGAFHEAQAVQGTAADNSAEGWYTDFLAQRPDNTAVRVALGDHYLRRAKTAEAIVEYEQALALEPTAAGHYLAAAEAYVAANRLEDAEAALHQARRLEPALPDAYLALAKLYRGQSRFDEARALYQAGLAVAPTDGTLLVAYADFLIERGEQDQGQQLLAQADQVAPTVEMLLARAQLYSRLAQNTAALADLQAARAKEPGSLDVVLALGDLYRVMGDNTNAQKTYAEASKLSPGVAAGRVRLARVAQ